MGIVLSSDIIPSQPFQCKPESKTVPLYGLSGVIEDLRIEGDWVLMTLGVDSEWTAGLMLEFDDAVPGWVKVGAKVEVVEGGLKLLSNGRKAKSMIMVYAEQGGEDTFPAIAKG